MISISRKTILILAGCFSFVSLSFAADYYWDGGGSDDNWITVQNWTGDIIPPPAERVILDGAGQTIIIASGVSVVPRKILGPCENTAGTVTLTVAGELTNTSYWYMARDTAGVGILNIDGGTVNTRDLIVAAGDSYTGIVNIDSGLLNINGDTEGVGACFGYDPTAGTTSGSAQININSGILQVSFLNTMGSNALINISQGQMILPGDQQTLIENYINAGQIIGYSGSGVAAVDYDNLNPGKTTVYAFADIQTVIASVDAGSTVYIPAGTYDEGSFNIDKSITLIASAGPENTVINISGNGLCVISDDISIDGFTIRNQTLSLTYLLRVGRSNTNAVSPVTNFRMENCILQTDNLTDGITVYGDNDNVDILSCTIHDCVNGIVIYDNALNVSIINNDIYENSYGIRVLGSQDQLAILSNGIYWNTSYAIANSGTVAVVAENNYWGHYTGPYHAQLNPAGQANAVSDHVNFEPFLVGCSDDRWNLCPAGDLNKDCMTNLTDLAILASGWLQN